MEVFKNGHLFLSIFEKWEDFTENTCKFPPCYDNALKRIK